MNLLRRATRILGRVGRATAGLIAVSSVAILLVVGVGPYSGRYRTLTVLTASMRPSIPAGSLVVVVPVDPAQVRVDDVISFHAPVPGGPVVTHRVIEIVEPGHHPVIRTKGDASDSADPWRARITDDRAWMVRAVLPGLGQAVGWLRQPIVHRLTVLVAPALFAVALLVDIWKKDPRPEAASPAPTGMGARRP